MSLNRRDFLKVGAASGGGLLLSVALSGCESAPEDDKSWAGDDFIPAAWIRISSDNAITFYIDRSEMGQGVSTSLPMLLAEELDVVLETVNVEFAPAHPRFDSPRLFMMMTGGSTSIAESFLPMRRAGATARLLLINAAAQRWGLDSSACTTNKGRVMHPDGQQSFHYGELASLASTLSVDENKVKLKLPSEYHYIGKPIPRLDNEIKVNGRAGFGIDQDLPGLLVGVVIRSPWFGGFVSSYDAENAKVMGGVQGVVPISSGIAVVADSYWQAREATKSVIIEWDKASFSGANEGDLRAEMQALAGEKGSKLLDIGDFEGSFSSADKTLAASYRVPYLAHATMEPMNCTARVQKDHCDIWVPTQAQSSAQALAAGICGFKLEQVAVHTTFLGGGFGRRAKQDFVVEAVETSKALGKPVKIIWSREDDMQHDYYRPPAVSVLKAGLDSNGFPQAWFHKMVNTSVVADSLEGGLLAGMFPGWVPYSLKDLGGDLGAKLVRNTNEPISTEGGVDIPYSIPHQRVERVKFNFPVPLGFWRSVGHSHTAFMIESFIDELAHLAEQDPFQYRLRLLKNKPRHSAVLERAAALAGWGAQVPAGRARGVAQHSSFGSYVAQVAEVSVDKSGGLRVHKVACAIDCGQVVNPDIVVAQMESAIIFGLTAALKGEITIENGGVKQSNFHDYPLLRIDEVPEIEVSIIDSTEMPSGAGEPGTPPIAPAVANAFFALSGKRVRELPLSSEVLGS